MRLPNILVVSAFVVYLGIGLVQLAAIVNGIHIWLSLPWFVAAFLSLIIAYVPILGTIAGIKGATNAWGWRLTPAIIFFCAPYVVYLAATTVGGLVDLLHHNRWFGRRNIDEPELEDGERRDIIADFGALLERDAERGVLVGKLSDLPHPKELIRRALRAEILLHAVSEPGSYMLRQLENAYILLEDYIQDEQAEPLQLTMLELKGLRILQDGNLPDERAAFEQSVRRLGSRPDPSATFTRMQVARKEALGELEAIRLIAREMQSQIR